MARGSDQLTTALTLHARAYAAPARAGWLIPEATTESVAGWLLEASDGRNSGWWGPVMRDTAELAVSIFARVEEATPATPGQWAHRMRRAVRHAHVGLGAVAIGAAELAAWDLIGQRESAPIWALCAGKRPEATSVYLTFLGMRPTSGEARDLSRRLAQYRSLIQKWDAVPPRSLLSLVERTGSPDRIALDMKGRWDFAEARHYCENLPAGLGWIEEPLPPWEIYRAPELDLRSPLAAGEHCYGLAEIDGLRAAGVTVFQPDAVFCGGFTELQRIASTIRPGERLVPHGGGLLPALHLAAAGAQVDIVEWHLRLEPRRLAHLAFFVQPREDLCIEAPSLPGWAGRLAPEVRLS